MKIPGVPLPHIIVCKVAPQILVLPAHHNSISLPRSPLAVPKYPPKDFHHEIFNSKKISKLVNLTEGGKKAFKEYQSSIAAADDNAGGGGEPHLLETYWDMHACHPGNAPDDWVISGGLPQMGYRSKLDAIQRIRVNYDSNKYDSDIFDVLVDDDGKEYEVVKDCMMHFGTELEFDPS
eukprot:8307293-Ditylum_brightwellii.AAC.1